MTQSLPVQMHPRYSEFVQFMADCPYRKTPSEMQTAFWVWLELNETREWFEARPKPFDVEKAVLIADMSVMQTETINQNMILKAEIDAQKSMNAALRESNQELKKDLDRKHRECAERERQCALQAEYISELVQDGAKVAKTENTSIQARIDGLQDVFMLASLTQFKYVQDISEPNGHNFKVSMAGGHFTHGTPEQYDAFMDKYLTWLESR
jgi:hypothetical protein